MEKVKVVFKVLHVGSEPETPSPMERTLTIMPQSHACSQWSNLSCCNHCRTFRPKINASGSFGSVATIEERTCVD